MRSFVRPGFLMAVLLTATLVSAFPGIAEIRGSRLVGTVTEVNEEARRFELRDSSGTLHELVWDSRTAMLTRPRVGLRMRVFVETATSGPKRVTRAGKADKPVRR